MECGPFWDQIQPLRTLCHLEGFHIEGLGVKAFIPRCKTRPFTFSSAAITNIVFVGFVAQTTAVPFCWVLGQQLGSGGGSQLYFNSFPWKTLCHEQISTGLSCMSGPAPNFSQSGLCVETKHDEKNITRAVDKVMSASYCAINVHIGFSKPDLFNRCLLL